MRPLPTVISLLALALICPSAFAHRVGADAYVSKDGKTIQVEAWLSPGGTPKKGTVTVIGEDGAEVAQGNLQNGVFLFNPKSEQRFSFVVNLAEGHVKKFQISQTQFAKLRLDGGGETTEPASPEGHLTPTPFPSAERFHEEDDTTLDRAILGLVLIISLTSLAILARLNKRIRQLEHALSKSEKRNRGDTSS